MSIEFEWDEKKRRANIYKHGIDFACAEELFEGPMFFEADKKENYGELRFFGLGLVGDRVIMVSYTNRSEKVIRIISMRIAKSSERKLFLKFLKEMEGKS